ncbi:unnamed protein product [Albugo candida]|nr:unnamed protein product [Albugo candida]|eukprot:CCI45810.1 unnamed protein product [Albugo candida]
MMEQLDVKFIRDFQKRGYLCSAQCFDDKTSSSEQIQNCVERCQFPMQQLQNVIQQELQSFQNRLQRCAMDCQDRARDSIPINEKVDHMTQSRMQKEMEACVGQCVDKQIQCIPTLQKRLEQNITQVSSQQ